MTNLLDYAEKQAKREIDFFCGLCCGESVGVRNETLVNMQRMCSSHRCGQIMTGRLVLYNIFTGNPLSTVCLSVSLSLSRYHPLMSGLPRTLCECKIQTNKGPRS